MVALYGKYKSKKFTVFKEKLFNKYTLDGYYTSMKIIYRDILYNWTACWKIAGIVGILIIVINKKINHTIKQDKSYGLLLFLDGVFLYYLLHVTLLSRQIGFRREIVLLPFSGVDILSGDFHYVIENILLFIPFGILLYATLCVYGKKCDIKMVLLTSFLTSLSVETIQYIFSCGESETDDIITNVLGAVIGYMLVKLKIYVTEKRTFN